MNKNKDDDNDDIPNPSGTLTLQTVAMPADTNPRGDIFAGWLVSQMDMAAAIAALKVARGRVATVAIDSMHFLTAVHVGAVVSCYTELVDIWPQLNADPGRGMDQPQNHL